MPNPGQPFLDGDDVTASRLNALVREQSFVSGEVPGAALADLAVSRAKIADGAVDNAKVEPNTLNANRLIGAAEISGTRVGQTLVSQTNGDFAPKPVSGDIKVNADGVAEIQPKVVSAAKLADNAVESRVIKQGAVLTQHLNTLLTDTSGSAGNYACSVEGVELSQGLEIKLLVTRTNTGTPSLVGALQGQVTLAFNNGTPKAVLKPGGVQFDYGEIPGGSIISLAYTGTHWQMLSPWLFLSRQTEDLHNNGTFTIPNGATRLRIRLWGAGGAGSLSNFGASSYGSGGGGAFAEWEGLLSQGGFAPQDVLSFEISQLFATVKRHTAPGTILLKCGHGRAPGYQSSVTVADSAGLYKASESALHSMGGGVRFENGGQGNFGMSHHGGSFLEGGKGSNGRGKGGSIDTTNFNSIKYGPYDPASVVFDATVPVSP